MNYQSMRIVPLGKTELEIDVIDMLRRLLKSVTGKDARYPIWWLLQHAQSEEDEALVIRIDLQELFFKFVNDNTTNQEVINARNKFDLLNLYLDDMERRIEEYENIIGGNTQEPIGEYVSVTINFIEQEG